MSLRDLCDVAYVMQVERIERTITPLMGWSAGADPAKAIAEFDDALNEEPTMRSESSGVREMKHLLGMR